MTDSTERPKKTNPAWKHNLVLHGGPFGGLWLPDDAIVTTDSVLLDHAMNRGCAPYEVMRLQNLVVLQLGYAQISNPLLNGTIWEVVLARRDAYQAPTWLLISEDPAVDPHFAIDWRTKRVLANWHHIHLYGDGELACNLRPATRTDDPVEAAMLDQIREANELPADYRDMVGELADSPEGLSSSGESEQWDDEGDDDDDEYEDEHGLDEAV